MEKGVSINGEGVKFKTRSDISFPLAVCSHERSGTHFLMNALSNCTKYTQEPFINFDLIPLGNMVNFYSAGSVKKFLAELSEIQIEGEYYCASSLIKSHHAAGFFAHSLQNTNLKVLYIYRTPVDVLKSYWQFLNRWDWLDSPKLVAPHELAASAPQGRAMRYQLVSYSSYFDRWAAHVSDWLELAARNTDVIIVRYEELEARFERQMARICESAGVEVERPIVAPGKENYIKGAPTPVSDLDIERLEDYCAMKMSQYPALQALFADSTKPEVP